MVRYTSLGLFAVPVAPARFLTQGPIPVLNFVLSATQTLSQRLRVSARMNFSVSVTDNITLTLAV